MEPLSHHHRYPFQIWYFRSYYQYGKHEENVSLNFDSKMECQTLVREYFMYCIQGYLQQILIITSSHDKMLQSLYNKNLSMRIIRIFQIKFHFQLSSHNYRYFHLSTTLPAFSYNYINQNNQAIIQLLLPYFTTKLMQGSVLVHDLRKVITLVDLLRDIGLDKQLSLPKVVVLGNQSSGKSSLLEQIVGLDFLPRGSGVVTRRPLELRMNNIPDLKQPYAQFDEVVEGAKKKKFTDFNLVRKAIDEVTDKVCGKSKQIIDNPIVLNIFSNSCPNLTIVDLPGITSIPVGGQPKNIYEITKNMALRYVGEKRSIILCVIPANQDLSTSQALKILGEIDPTGERSIGCLTKIDIMDRGVDAKKILKNQEIPLRYGYVGIKNRSQEDINNNIPVSQSLKAERKYFTTSPIYSTLPPESFSTESLTHKLTSILYTQIKSSMPQIFKEIMNKKKQAELELDKLGPGVASTDAEMVNYAWKSISDFLRIFKNSMNGIKNVDFSNEPISAEIRRELNQLYEEQFSNPATESITDKEIQRAITNYPGDSIPGFPSIDAFLALLNPLLKKLEQPAFSINYKIHEIMQNECIKIIDSVMIKKFPDFNYRFTDLIKRVLDKYKKELESYLKILLDSELNQLYTNDISYLQGQFGLTEKDRKKIQNNLVKDPLLFELRKRIDSYFKLCVRNLRDLIPKQVFNFLIVKCIKEMEFESFQFTSDVNKLKEWLNEPGQVRTKRLEYQKAIKVFEESERKIRMDPEIAKLIKDTSKQSKYYHKYGMKSPEEQNQQKEKQREKIRMQRIAKIKKQNQSDNRSVSTQGGSLQGRNNQGGTNNNNQGGTNNNNQGGSNNNNQGGSNNNQGGTNNNNNQGTNNNQGANNNNQGANNNNQGGGNQGGGNQGINPNLQKQNQLFGNINPNTQTTVNKQPTNQNIGNIGMNIGLNNSSNSISNPNNNTTNNNAKGQTLNTGFLIDPKTIQQQPIGGNSNQLFNQKKINQTGFTNNPIVNLGTATTSNQKTSFSDDFFNPPKKVEGPKTNEVKTNQVKTNEVKTTEVKTTEVKTGQPQKKKATLNKIFGF